MLPEHAQDLDEAHTFLRALRARDAASFADDERCAHALYLHWYHGALARDFRRYPSGGAFRAATATAERFVPGWRVAELAPHGVVAARGAERLELLYGECAPRDARRPLAIGAELRVLERVTQSVHGFWHLYSLGWRNAAPDVVLRLYLAITPGAELEVARILAATAPSCGTWYAKFLCGTHTRGRRDPAVLYLPADASAEPWLARFAAAASELLQGPRTRCTAAHAVGLWYAPNPGGLEQSYGQVLCRALVSAARRMPSAESAEPPGEQERFRTAFLEALPCPLPTAAESSR